MKAKQILKSGLVLTGCFLLLASPRGYPEEVQSPLVRLAEIEIFPDQLGAYKAALKEEIAASIRLEPGVLNLYAVSVKEHPEQVRLFEVYRDSSAYQAHLQSPHFKKYKEQTRLMVKSLKLVETDTILLGSKSNS